MTTNKRDPAAQLAMFLGGAQKAVEEDERWSAQQRAIFNERAGTGNIAVEARAGTGKTTTAVELIKRFPASKKILYAAFNVAIKEAVRSKLLAHRNVDVKTLHGVGMSVLRQYDDAVQVDQDKGIRIAREVVGPNVPAKFAAVVKKAAGYLKALAIDSDMSGGAIEEAEDVLIDAEFEADPFANTRELAQLALRSMNASKQMLGVVDFDDQVWLPVVLGLQAKYGYDYVVIDEAQDMNEGQLRLCLSVVKPNGRVIVIGDPKQAIYGWRGADPKAFPRLVKRLNAKVFPLTTTYRCARKIVEEANTIVPDFYPAPDAPDGIVEYLTRAEMMKLVKPGDFVLSRANAPLVTACTAAIRAGIRSNIQGRDLGESLVAMVNKAHAEDVEELLEWVDDWRVKQIEKRQAKGHDPQPIIDRAECLIAFADGMKSIGEVLRNITTMFADVDDNSRVVFSSVHRAKGLERDRVFILRSTFMKPRTFIDDFGEQVFDVPTEEKNLYYVATTRAKSALYIVTG